jgi:hypothetical protein
VDQENEGCDIKGLPAGSLFYVQVLGQGQGVTGNGIFTIVNLEADGTTWHVQFFGDSPSIGNFPESAYFSWLAIPSGS